MHTLEKPSDRARSRVHTCLDRPRLDQYSDIQMLPDAQEIFERGEIMKRENKPSDFIFSSVYKQCVHEYESV